MMSENPHKKQDFLEIARHQFAQISAEVEKALDALKDQERRKQMTSSYLDMLQKGLSRAQDSVAKYQEKVAPQPPAEPPAQPPTEPPEPTATTPDSSASPEP
jgi:cytochrome c553